MTSDAITGAHWLQVTREECERDFTFFVRYFFKRRKGFKFIFEEFHRTICADLMRVWRGEIRNLIVNCPPRYSKTELIVVMFSAWCFMKNPRCEFIHLSYADKLVRENSNAIKEIIKSAEFRALWPELTVKVNKDAGESWELAQGGKFYAAAHGGQVTGFGAGRMDEVQPDGTFKFSGCLTIDDPLKPDDARSEPLRNAVNARWDDTIKSRRNSPTTPTIVLMQRVHEKDFTAHLLASTEEDWHQLVLPALLDEGLPTERPLWPAKHSHAVLLAMKADPGSKRMFPGQMQQRPAALGGDLIRGDWFGRWEVLPPIDYRKIYVDTAQKTGERNDYSVLQCWGTDGRRIYLLDQDRGKWEAPELKRRALAFWAKHLAQPDVGTLRQMRIEDKASGTGLIQDIRLAGQIPIYAQQRDRDKFLRVGDGAPYIEAGLVVIPAAAPFTKDFIDENEAFTADDTHAHDDQIDPMLDAIEDMLSSLNTLKTWEKLL